MQEILNSSKFNALVSQKNLIAFLLTCIQLVVYYGFIYLLAFKKRGSVDKDNRGYPSRYSSWYRGYSYVLGFNRYLHLLG